MIIKWIFYTSRFEDQYYNIIEHYTIAVNKYLISKDNILHYIYYIFNILLKSHY